MIKVGDKVQVKLPDDYTGNHGGYYNGEIGVVRYINDDTYSINFPINKRVDNYPRDGYTVDKHEVVLLVNKYSEYLKLDKKIRAVS